MSIVNSVIDLVFNSIQTWNLLMLESTQAINAYRNSAVQELDKAAKEFDYGDISTDIYNSIVVITDGDCNREQKLMAKAIATERWIKYTFYCLTNPDSVIIAADKEAQELVNGIANFVIPEVGPIYKNAEIANLHKYNCKELVRGYNGEYILDLDGIIKRFNTSLVEKAKEKFFGKDETELPDSTAVPILTNPEVITNTGRFDGDGYFHPIFLKGQDTISKENNSIPVKPDFMPEDLFNRFEDVFNPIVNTMKYYYALNNDGNWCINIVSHNGLSVSSYILDDGTIMGGTGIYILGRYQNVNYVDTIFVNVEKFQDIAAKIISDPYYIMSSEDVSRASSDLLAAGVIYHNIDFSNSSFMDDATTKNNIETSLLGCINILDDPDIRLRFDTFMDSNHFTLTSDNICKSPMAKDNITASKLIPGLKLIVEDNTITKVLGGQGTKYQF